MRQWEDDEATRRLFTDDAVRRAPTPLHSAADAGARSQQLKAWQQGLDLAVQQAADSARRKRGASQRTVRRAAERASLKYRAKHPRP